MLRTRDGVDELIVNGVFAMDSAEVSSEQALADAALPAVRVLVGGLGLGYTAARLLDGGAGHVRVVELSGELVDAARRSATAQLGRLAADPRVELVIGDVADAIEGTWDAILLDVDNGPEGLTRQSNDGLYDYAGLRAAKAALRPKGVLAVWSQGPDQGFTRRLSTIGFDVKEEHIRAGRKRGARHVIWLASTDKSTGPAKP